MEQEIRRIEHNGGGEQIQLVELAEKYNQVLAEFSEEVRIERIGIMENAFDEVTNMLKNTEGFVFDKMRESILRIKMARYFQRNSSIDINTLYDALIETPKFIDKEKGSLHRLFEIHEQKTLMKIAEMRKQRAEITGDEAFNPYEYIYNTSSEKYTLARLFNMPHLEEESTYMKHCVGTSDSYINKIKRGDIEILSFRASPKINNKTGKLEADEPLVTIEYNPKNGEILQMRKKNDLRIRVDDVFWNDLLEVLINLKYIYKAIGEERTLSKIKQNELLMIPVSNYHILTNKGEIHFRDFDPDRDPDLFLIKGGTVPLTSDISQQDAVKLIRIFEGKIFEPSIIARTPEEIGEDTRVYVGPLFKNIFHHKNIEYIYTGFPEGEIIVQSLKVDIGGQPLKDLERNMEKNGLKISNTASEMLGRIDFTKQLEGKETRTFCCIKVGHFGFDTLPNMLQLYEKAKEFGLEVCPPEVAPYIRLQYTDQPNGASLIGTRTIFANFNGEIVPHIFTLYRNESDVQLGSTFADPEFKWSFYRKFFFLLPK